MMSDKRSTSVNDAKISEVAPNKKRFADYFAIVGLDGFGHELELETGGELTFSFVNILQGR